MENSSSELKKIFNSSKRFFLYVGLLWIVFYSIYLAFPYIRPGGIIIYEAKLKDIGDSITFPENAKYKVIIFGSSRILAGFIPEVFDSLDPSIIYSYNLGLPDAAHFLPELQDLIHRGQISSHVLLTLAFLSIAVLFSVDYILARGLFIKQFIWSKSVLRRMCYRVCFYSIVFFGVFDKVEFIYFQF